MGHHLIFNLLIAALLVIYPCWRIFRRVGLNPAFSLFIFVPALGWWIAGLLLAYSTWPAFDAKAGGGTSNA